MAYDLLPVINDTTARFLEKRCLLTPIVGQKRKISASMLTPPTPRSPSPPSSSSSSRVSSASFSALSVGQEVEEVEIPADLRSKETFEFLGFDDTTAATLWQRFLDQPADMGADIINFARWQVRYAGSPDATSATDDWDGCMIKMGLTVWLRQAILLPEYYEIRFTASCSYWVIEAMEAQWETLQVLDSRVRMVQARIQHQARVLTGRPKAESILSMPSQPYSSGRKPSRPLSSSSSELQPQLQEADPTSVEDQNRSTLTVAAAVDAPEKMQQHTMLWRAGFKWRHEGFYDETTGNINLAAISSFPGDFSGERKLPYFTPQRHTADRYAQWLKHKARNTEITIAQVALDWSWVERLTTEYIWFTSPNNIWKKVIFNCRRGLPLPDELEDLEKRDILIGHIASGKNVKYERLTSYEQIRDCLSVEEEGHATKAIQWAFQTRKARQDFETHCKGKIWIHSVGTFKHSHVTKDVTKMGES
ncbi:MAG: hypothetical protein M1816_003610 [Peltula sp. TS41687]|nr:MAG: hypothetical protein M1816_003610 [Peltula sp. TS41687]